MPGWYSNLKQTPQWSGWDVVWPASSTDNALARFDSTTWKLLQDGTITQDDSWNLASVWTLNTHTIPSGTDTLVWRATTDTLTNKTLTSPVINTPTGIVKWDVGLWNVDNTSDSTKNSATATLTNKTLTDPKITADINTQTGTTYTLVLTDQSKIVEMNNASSNTVTIPTNASVAFPTGTTLKITQYGAWITTATGDTWVTVNGTSAWSFATTAQYQTIYLYKRDTNEWVASLIPVSAGWGGGDMVQLSQTEISTAVSSVDFDNTVFTSDYKSFVVVWYVEWSANARVEMKISDDNGSTFETFEYVFTVNYSTSEVNTYNISANTYITWNRDVKAGDYCTFRVDLPPTSPHFTALYSSGFWDNSGGRQARVSGSVWSDTAYTFNYLSFLMDTWNITDGVITVYWLT